MVIEKNCALKDLKKFKRILSTGVFQLVLQIKTHKKKLTWAMYYQHFSPILL